MNRGAHAELWAGPEDGTTVWMPPGELPDRVGVHRTADGKAVTIRGGILDRMVTPGHIAVYRRCPDVRPDLVLPSGQTVPVYVWQPATAGHCPA